jgi:hypothetical protein
MDWFELDSPRGPRRAIANQVTLEPHEALVVTVATHPGRWRMALVRARATDPDTFRGQTEVTGGGPPSRLIPPPPPPPRP